MAYCHRMDASAWTVIGSVAGMVAAAAARERVGFQLAHLSAL